MGVVFLSTAVKGNLFFHLIHSFLKVLIAPLNWGLGHATRCIPIIRALEELGVEIILASDGAALYLLRAEFPHLEVVEIPSYRIQYGSSNMIVTIARQLPRILFAIRSEQWAVERLVRERGITHIISDNRYGCFSRKTKSVLITHQLHVIVPGRPLEWLANRVIKRAIRKFDCVWAPDLPEINNLAGKLAHPPLTDPPVHYVGLLSRLKPGENDNDYDVAVVLSGPEPQRTALEQRLIEQAITLPYKFIIIQGRPKRKHHHYVADNVEIVSYLTSEDLNEVLLGSRAIVCRAGYSSIMDLAVLGKKALLVPTPGQTEQEYLARRLSEEGHFVVQRQDQINLEAGLEQLQHTQGLDPSLYTSDAFRQVLENWINPIAD